MFREEETISTKKDKSSLYALFRSLTEISRAHDMKFTFQRDIFGFSRAIEQFQRIYR